MNKRVKPRTNEVVLEQHYPSLLATGTPLMLLSVSGAVWKHLFGSDNFEIQADRLHCLSRHDSREEGETEWDRHAKATKKTGIRFVLYLFLPSWHIMSSQVVQTLAASAVMRLLSWNRILRQQQQLFRNQMQQMSSSLSATNCNSEIIGQADIVNTLIKDRFQQGHYSCPPSLSPCRSECHKFLNSSPGHDNSGGGRWGRRRK